METLLHRLQIYLHSHLTLHSFVQSIPPELQMLVKVFLEGRNVPRQQIASCVLLLCDNRIANGNFDIAGSKFYFAIELDDFDGFGD